MGMSSSNIYAETNEEKGKLFALKIYPLLKHKCYGCHGEKPNRLKGDYDVSSLESLLKGGESGEPSIVIGKPEKSLLMSAIRWEDLEMPPKKNDRLTEEEIAHFEKWIKDGAIWLNEAQRKEVLLKEKTKVETKEGILISTSGGTSDEWTYRRYKKEEVWAFRPLTPVANPKKETHPVDAFIDAKLKSLKLEASKQADPKTLLKRLSYDLTGLPPTIKEQKTFLKAWKKDPDQAWNDQIDHYLSSPHYGERWAQHWLDVVRYADTSGFSNDYERSNAWRYRDYVIRSFNKDKPYNRFILEQLAGDELDDKTPETIVATGFLRMGPWGTAMIPQEEARQIYRDDLVQTVGQTFLSIPMRCSKCHDHKFDPIPTRDYYRLYAAFSATQPAEMPAEFLPEESKVGFENERKLVKSLFDYAEKDRKRLVNKRETAARKWYKENNLPYKNLKERKDDPDDKKPPRHVGLDYVDEGTLKVREQDCWIWSRRLERFKPMAQSVFNGQDVWQNARKLRKPEKINQKWRPQNNIFEGGARTAKGPAVNPGVLSSLGIQVPGVKTEDPYLVPDSLDGRRLAVARWIAHPKNSLSTRSIVNRIWQYHFGKGIVKTSNNFGVKGSAPTHPELLDWLAKTFIENGWSFKKLHKVILTSETYKRSSQHAKPEQLDKLDPNNNSYARFIPRMLSAEEIRDSLLRITGELNPTLGGIPVRPEINMEVALEPRMIQFSIAPAYQPSRTPKERNRRSIYAYRIRGQADPFLQVLNHPNPNDSCERRETTAVTPQALTLLNSDIMSDRSIGLALRLQKERKGLKQQLKYAFKLVFGRNIDSDELTRLKKYVQQMETYHQEHQPKAKTYPKEIVRSLVEEFSGKPFTYTEWLPGFNDYVPDPKPWTVDAKTRALADACLLLMNANEFVYVY